MDSINLSRICANVISLINEVGSFIQNSRKTFDKGMVSKKAKNDLVSYVDFEAEKLLVKGLSEILPDSGFITEENTKNELKEFNWIVDPLDGTTNFIHGIPFYCISVALSRKEEILLGVVLEISSNEIFHTYKGTNSFLNGKAVFVSDNHLIEDSLIATGFPVNNFDFMNGYKNAVEKFIRNTHGVRRMGSAAMDLCYIACGRFDGYFELNLKPWDVAAGAFIVKNSGGVVTDFSGGNDWLFGKNIIASSKKINEEFQKIINYCFSKEIDE